MPHYKLPAPTQPPRSDTDPDTISGEIAMPAQPVTQTLPTTDDASTSDQPSPLKGLGLWFKEHRPGSKQTNPPTPRPSASKRLLPTVVNKVSPHWTNIGWSIIYIFGIDLFLQRPSNLAYLWTIAALAVIYFVCNVSDRISARLRSSERFMLFLNGRWFPFFVLLLLMPVIITTVNGSATPSIGGFAIPSFVIQTVLALTYLVPFICFGLTTMLRRKNVAAAMKQNTKNVFQGIRSGDFILDGYVFLPEGNRANLIKLLTDPATIYPTRPVQPIITDPDAPVDDPNLFAPRASSNS